MNYKLSQTRKNALLFLYGSTALFSIWGGLKEFLFTRVNEPLAGVAFSFWFAYGLLCLLGLKHPLKLLPVLLLQFTYKSIWIFAVGFPLFTLDQMTPRSYELLYGNAVYVLLDLIILPWGYIFKHFFFSPKAS